MEKYTYLSLDERVLISHYHDSGVSSSQIARKLGRHKSTISRELRRNANKARYKPKTAHKRYVARRQRPCFLDQDLDLQRYVLERLYEGFTPELISLRLKRMGNIEQIKYVNHESIYRWLYQPNQKKQKLYNLLPQHHAKRGRRKRVHRSQIKHRMPIQDRPVAVETRQSIGHWEADLMSFKQNRQHMLVIHERKTRYTAAIKLKTKKADETLETLLSFLKTLPRHLRQTVTFDNGMEFSLHHQLNKKLGIKTYFCDVYASWQKGGIENMNGRLRRDLPRKTDLLSMADEDLQQILFSHNLMPRKVLNGYSPLEVLAKHLGRVILFSFNHQTVATHP